MSRMPTMRSSSLLGRGRAAGILVLPFVTLLDGVFPGYLVSLELGVVPGLRIGLTLILALLVNGDRGLLAAPGQTPRERHGHRYDQRSPHDLVAPGCAGAAPGFGSGLP